MLNLSCRVLVPGTPKTSLGSFSLANHNRISDKSPLLMSTVGLSFWGGIDPVTAQVVDAQHPLHGHCVKDTILALPTGRGSCTASQVLLQLIVNRMAPSAIVLRQNDPLVTVGALVAQHIFATKNQELPIPTIVVLGSERYQSLWSTYQEHQQTGGDALLGIISAQGSLQFGTNDEVFGAESSEREEEEAMNIRNPLNEYDSWTAFEEERYQQAQNEAERLALKVIFQYARIAAARDDDEAIRRPEVSNPSYVFVSRAHIDACTYIGSGSLDLVQTFVQAGGKVKIPTTLNSQSTDRTQWEQLGVPIQYATNANSLGDAYLQLGCQPTFTCAPYLLLNENSNSTEGQDWVWGESNAVVYANSVLGARTNKTADYLDVCGALTGIMPCTGMHVEDNRVPTVLLDATKFVKSQLEDWDLSSSLFFAVLGHLCGSLSDGGVPLLLGLEQLKVTTDDLKTFCAAFGTTGSAPLIHIAGITAEVKKDTRLVGEWTEQLQVHDQTVKQITNEDMRNTYQTLNGDETAEQTIDLIALGNPHLSVSECKTMTELIQIQSTAVEQSKHANVRIMACISRAVQEQADQQGYIQPLRDFGVEFVNDTCWCMLLDPPVIPPSPTATILTHSGKYAHYGPGLTQRQLRLGSLADCIQTARSGVFRPQTRSFSTSAVAGWGLPGKECWTSGIRLLRRFR